MKLVIAVVHNEDARVLIDALLAHEYRATWLHSSGGFLKQANATILLGVADDKVDDVVALVRDNCRARTQTVSPIPPIMEPTRASTAPRLLPPALPAPMAPATSSTISPNAARTRRDRTIFQPSAAGDWTGIRKA